MQSPLKLFRSLKHGDPQAIAIAAVLIFLVSVCWFSYTFLVPPKADPLPLGGGRRDAEPPPQTVSLNEVLEVQRVFLAPDDVPNPFFREIPKPKPSENQNNRPRPRPPRNQATEETKPKLTPEPPKTRPMTLTYRGLLMRPDQTTVALVEVAEDGSRKFIQVGDRLTLFLVNEITPEGIQIQQDKGPAIFLERGTPQRFEVPL